MSQTITVEGMSCGGCEETVEEALRNIEGVEQVEVDRTTNSATIDGDADTEDLVTVVEEAGYEASA